MVSKIVTAAPAAVLLVVTDPPDPLADLLPRGTSYADRWPRAWPELARELARAHGGHLSLTRADEEWTEFQLVLPMSRIQDSAAQG